MAEFPEEREITPTPQPVLWAGPIPSLSPNGLDMIGSDTKNVETTTNNSIRRDALAKSNLHLLTQLLGLSVNNAGRQQEKSEGLCLQESKPRVMFSTWESGESHKR